MLASNELWNTIITALMAIVVAICATVAAAIGVLSGEALAGIYGAIIGGGAVATMPLRSRRG
jgi:hypothetical protein